jgi:hypothetical protein
MTEKPKLEKNLAQYLAEAIHDDYLITIAITSYTQAKYQTKNLPFGLGKTTLYFWLSYYLNGGSVKDNGANMNAWNKVFETTVYNPYDMAKLLEPSRPRLFCAGWDDVQATAPSSQSVPIPIRELANFISTERPECACIFFTTPNLNSISAPLRKLINFEIIVSERGFYEVHKIRYYKDFNHPLQDRMHFDYVDEIPRNEPFLPLPKEIKERYERWRVEQKLQLYPSMMKKLKQYTQLKQWLATDAKDLENIPALTARVVRGGSGLVLSVHDQELLTRLKGKELTIMLTPSG